MNHTESRYVNLSLNCIQRVFSVCLCLKEATEWKLARTHAHTHRSRVDEHRVRVVIISSTQRPEGTDTVRHTQHTAG